MKRIRSRKPLVHHLTNFVVMNNAANVTLAVGASPIMAYVREETDSLVYASLDVVEKLAWEYGGGDEAEELRLGRQKARRGQQRHAVAQLRYITSADRMASSVITSFMAVNRDLLAASVEGLVTFEIVAEKKASGSAALKVHLID